MVCLVARFRLQRAIKSSLDNLADFLISTDFHFPIID